MFFLEYTDVSYVCTIANSEFFKWQNSNIVYFLESYLFHHFCHFEEAFGISQGVNAVKISSNIFFFGNLDALIPFCTIVKVEHFYQCDSQG